MLRALPGHAVVLAHGQGQLAETRLRPGGVAVERVEVLHGALAVGLLADDDAATVVLDGAGEDLRGGRAEAIHQDGERSVIDGLLRLFLEHLDAAAGVP